MSSNIKGCSEIISFLDYYTHKQGINVVKNKVNGIFGGTGVNYTYQSDNGLVKVSCNHGMDTMFRLFTNIGVNYLGSFKSIGNSVGSEGSKVAALSMSYIDENGKFTAKMLVNTIEMQLPLPIHVKY